MESVNESRFEWLARLRNLEYPAAREIIRRLKEQDGAVIVPGALVGDMEELFPVRFEEEYPEEAQQLAGMSERQDPMPLRFGVNGEIYRIVPRSAQ